MVVLLEGMLDKLKVESLENWLVAMRVVQWDELLAGRLVV